MVDDLEVVHPVAGVHGEEVAAGLGGGPVELPVIIYIKCNCFPISTSIYTALATMNSSKQPFSLLSLSP